MSKRTEFVKELEQYAHGGGGSFKTRDSRVRKINQFGNWCWDNGFQLRSASSISIKHIQGFAESRSAAGISRRTIQNDLSAVRSVLRKIGKEHFADSNMISNKTLGLSGASRQGSKVAFPHSKFHALLSAAMGRDAGVAACIWLCRIFGLRAREAVMSPQSLPTWQRRLEQGERSIQVILGTKGGRTREVRVTDPESAKAVVNFCLGVMSANKGVLICRENLKKALDFFHNECRKLGLLGANSPHSLRYAYASELLEIFMLDGYSQKESLALVSLSLGHGDGRGRYVKSVYLRQNSA